MSSDEIERLLHHMPTVQMRAHDPWVKKFAHSITRQSRRRNWKPSPKQLAMMRKLVGELFGDDFQVLEGDE